MKNYLTTREQGRLRLLSSQLTVSYKHSGTGWDVFYRRSQRRTRTEMVDVYYLIHCAHAQESQDKTKTQITQNAAQRPRKPTA